MFQSLRTNKFPTSRSESTYFGYQILFSSPSFIHLFSFRKSKTNKQKKKKTKTKQKPNI